MKLLSTIQELCKAKGISVHKLETELGFGNRAIYKWNDTSPSIEKVIAVANYFGISVDALLDIKPAEITSTKNEQSQPKNIMTKRIKELCQKHNISIEELEKKAGFKSRIMYAWKRTSPSIDKIITIADYFQVSIDWLVGRKQKEIILGPNEIKLLETFCSMNEQGKLALLSAADGFFNNGIYKK